MQAQDFSSSTGLERGQRLGQEYLRAGGFPSLEQLPIVYVGDSLSLMKPSSCNPFEVLGHLESEAIAIIGSRLWTPLSVIQACLELLVLPEDGESVDRLFILELALQEMGGLEKSIDECLALFTSAEPSNELTEGELLSACPLQPTLELLHDTLMGVTERVAMRRHSGKKGGRWTTGFSDSAAAGRVYEPVTTEKSIKTPEEQAAYLKQLRSKLIAIVGHELRTPLCSLQVCLETFLSEPQQFSENDRQTLLELARTDLDRLRRLVQKFFTLSRLEQGLVLENRGLVDLEDTIDLVASSFPEDTPAICLDVPSALPLLRLDEDKLVLALKQLLDNAFQFAGPEGQITIEARYRPPTGWEGAIADHCGTIELVVADTGRGIDPQQLDKVFDCFYQEEDYLRRTVGGTGIGLSICRKLVEAMGGIIWAQSLGKELGSHIHVTLPTVSSYPMATVAA